MQRFEYVYLAVLLFTACGSSNGNTHAGATAAGAESPMRVVAGAAAGGAGSTAVRVPTAGVAGNTVVASGGRAAVGGAGAAGTSARAAVSGSGGPAAMEPSDMDGGVSADAGMSVAMLDGMGSCCAAHPTPGCGNADLQVCVCEKLPSCCTTAWTAACAFIVQEKFCQAGVRDCVCGTAQGQWGQAQCCASEWSSTCDSVAQLKCNAAPGCL
jgi:hypothetical protein